MKQTAYSGVLIIAETYGKRVHPVAWELMNKGRQIADACGESLTCLLLADGPYDSQQLCGRGADKVYLMVSPAFARPEEWLWAKNITAFLQEKKPATVLIGATPFGRSLAPRIAAALGTGLTADCTDLQVDGEGNVEQIRPAFSDHILAHIKTRNRPQMATVRYREFCAAAFDGQREICTEVIPPYIEENPRVRIDQVIPLGERDITDAEVIVAGGRGIRKAEDLALLQALADVLGGQVGVSRALVDAGMADSCIQVGYSGNRVKPKVYIACGISGAPQHLAGMKEAELIIAINHDPSAPIFRAADYGYVGDLYEIVPRLSAMLQKGGTEDEL
jgi:electron transfer flavoprotein alpha subunit